MGLGAKLADAATAGLTGAVTGGIGSIISSGLGLLGGLFKKNNNGLKNQQKLMQQAWEYEKEGMGLQYNYGQQAEVFLGNVLVSEDFASFAVRYPSAVRSSLDVQTVTAFYSEHDDFF